MNEVPTTLELVTRGFGIETLSPVQTAICLALDGLSLDGLWDDEGVRECFGGVRPPEVMPKVVLLIAASRALKSKMCAAAMMRAAMSCDLAKTALGDEVRLSVIGTEIDKAKPSFKNMHDLAERECAGLMRSELKQSFHIVRTAQISIEVTVSALTGGGGGVVSRWCAGALFSEAPRMVGEQDGERNITETLSALRNRMLPGAQIICEGSPWAPFGPIHDLDHKFFGRPSENMLVIRARGPLLWPEQYTPEYCASILAVDERAHQADVEGRYVDPEDSLIATVDIDFCVTRDLAERPPRMDENGKLTHEYVAAMDPATRGNAWTLVVLCAVGEDARGEIYEQALAVQWRGTQAAPLRPSEVLKDAKRLCAPYGVDCAMTDQASFDANADTGELVGFGLTGLFGGDDDSRADCGIIRSVISDHRLTLVDNAQQRTDLQRVKRRVTSNDYSYSYPLSGDGRHCDFVPALGRALRFAPPPPAKATAQGVPEQRRVAPSSQANFAKSLMR